LPHTENMVDAPARTRPQWWPHFSSTLRSTAVTARIGRVIAIAIGVCFLTGQLSAYQYLPWSWLPPPAAPVWGYRVTQGIHVVTGMALIPLVLLKLWSVYPDAFRWPPIRSIKHAIERFTLAILIASILLQLTTGFLRVLNWFPFPWDFATVHIYLAFVVLGSVLLHIGIKLPDIAYGLKAKIAEGDVLTEVPWWDNPQSHSNAGPLPPPVTPGISRRGVLTAASAGVGIVVITSVGQALTPLEPIGLLAPRQPSRGPQGVAVDTTAEEAQVVEAASAANWTLEITGPSPFSLSLADLEAAALRDAQFPVAAVEGWSVDASWRGIPLLDLVQRAGGSAQSRVRVRSLAPAGFNRAEIFGPQLSAALLATHLNDQRLSLDHGYPLRLIAPNRPSVLNVKWLQSVEVLS
jgi:hypothetical protein